MNGPILFDNALEAAVDALESAGVDLTGCEATLLRDLRGKLRLHIARPPDTKWPETARATLKKALASVAPFGTDVVHLAGNKEDPLTSVVERDRVPLPREVVGSIPRVATWFKVERRLSKDAWIIENQKDQDAHGWASHRWPGHEVLPGAGYGPRGVRADSWPWLDTDGAA